MSSPLESYIKRARKVKYSKNDYSNSYPVGGSDYYHDFDPTQHVSNTFDKFTTEGNNISNNLFDSSKNQLASITHTPSFYAESIDDDNPIEFRDKKLTGIRPNGVVNSKIQLHGDFYDLDDSERKKAFTHILDNIAHVNAQFNNGADEPAIFDFGESGEPFDLSDFEKHPEGYKFSGKPALWNVPDEYLSNYGHPNDHQHSGWTEYMDRWKNQDLSKIAKEKFSYDKWLNSQRPLIDDLHEHTKGKLKDTLDHQRLANFITRGAQSGRMPTKEELIHVADIDSGNETLKSLADLRGSISYWSGGKGTDQGTAFTKMGYPYLDWLLNEQYPSYGPNQAKAYPRRPEGFTINQLRDMLRKNGHKHAENIENRFFPPLAEEFLDDEEDDGN